MKMTEDFFGSKCVSVKEEQSGSKCVSVKEE